VVKFSEYLARLVPELYQPFHNSKPLHMAGACKIIVADDNADSATTISLVLKYHGYDARAVYGAPSALVLAKELCPQVMLIDIEMPRMDGYQLATAVRQDPDLKKTLLIAVTGYGGDHHKSRSFAAGFDYHLLKPLDTNHSEPLGPICALGIDRARSPHHSYYGSPHTTDVLAYSLFFKHHDGVGEDPVPSPRKNSDRYRI
jgi:two-component system CheB/CheR fusion protein